MKIGLFYHSLLSDWNHGNAHFLRGILKELQKRGHQVRVFEPKEGWSLGNLIKDHGEEPLKEFQQYYPGLRSEFYDPQNIDYHKLLEGLEVVIVHEWNPPELVAQIGKHKAQFGYRLLFHDTHHRAVSQPEEMERYDFSEYDGALVFGEVINRIYQEKKWIQKVWTWHEAADIDLFTPDRNQEKEGDLVWIGNWGDGERTRELMEFLIEPVQELGIKAKVYGVRYPDAARKALDKAGIEYGGWLPNYKVPEVFSKYKVTVHVPRRPYVELLPGIPTIRPFEAMACGIPLICSPWDDQEGLFTPGSDYMIAKDGNDMSYKLSEVLKSAQLAQSLSTNGRKTIAEKHTCSHRINELEHVLEELGLAKDRIYPDQTKTMT